MPFSSIASRLLNNPEIADLFKELAAKNPHPQGELNYINPYTLLVAVVLSAQSTDKGVNKVTASLFSVVQTPQQMIELGEEKLRQYLKSLGLYNSKAKNIMQLSQQLINDFNGQVPDNRQDLENLSGVGQKTAGVVLNIAFDQPAIPVDTHVFRVAQRTGLAFGKSPAEIEKMLEKRIPLKYQKNAHHWLILHGRYVCKARNPDCQNCCIQQQCLYPEKTGFN